MIFSRETAIVVTYVSYPLDPSHPDKISSATKPISAGQLTELRLFPKYYLSKQFFFYCAPAYWVVKIPMLLKCLDG